jgi:predicted deacetylase
MARAKLVVSLHDVTPAHADRLERAERFLASSGISPVTYLLVPDFHGRAAADVSGDFVGWCRASRRFDVQWFLHGYFHSDRVSPPAHRRLDLAARLASRLLTAREGEFVALRGDALRVRLRTGILTFERCLGAPPVGFVAPAWLFNGELLPALAQLHFRFTENHFRVFQLTTGRSRAAPVITWATRTTLRKYGSLAVATTLRRLWAAQPVLRIALHPYDFDHPATVASIARTLDTLRCGRETSEYNDALFER